MTKKQRVVYERMKKPMISAWWLLLIIPATIILTLIGVIISVIADTDKDADDQWQDEEWVRECLDNDDE